MAEGPFRNRGLSVAVDTSKEAEYDFSSHKITLSQLNRIAENLRSLPVSTNDRTVGDVRFRDVLHDHEVSFIITHQEESIVILILGLGYVGKLESNTDMLRRVGYASLPRPAREFFKGRKRLL